MRFHPFSQTSPDNTFLSGTDDLYLVCVPVTVNIRRVLNALRGRCPCRQILFSLSASGKLSVKDQNALQGFPRQHFNVFGFTYNLIITEKNQMSIVFFSSVRKISTIHHNTRSYPKRINIIFRNVFIFCHKRHITFLSLTNKESVKRITVNWRKIFDPF